MNRLSLYVAVLIVACAQSGAVSAHDSGVYESLEHIHIGRVFLSPTERVNLDRNRGVGAPVAASSGGPSMVVAAKNSKAAGYIVSSSGRTRVWKDGDFVAAKIPESIHFPGDVKVTRTADQVPTKIDTTAVDDESPAAGVADDAE